MRLGEVSALFCSIFHRISLTPCCEFRLSKKINITELWRVYDKTLLSNHWDSYKKSNFVIATAMKKASKEFKKFFRSANLTWYSWLLKRLKQHCYLFTFRMKSYLPIEQSHNTKNWCKMVEFQTFNNGHSQKVGSKWLKFCKTLVKRYVLPYN